VVFDKEVTKQTPSASAEKFTDASMSEGRGHNIPGRQCRYWCLLLATDYSAEDIDSTEDTNYETRQAPPLAASNVQTMAAVPLISNTIMFRAKKDKFRQIYNWASPCNQSYLASWTGGEGRAFRLYGSRVQ